MQHPQKGEVFSTALDLSQDPASYMDGPEYSSVSKLPASITSSVHPPTHLGPPRKPEIGLVTSTPVLGPHASRHTAPRGHSTLDTMALFIGSPDTLAYHIQ